MVVARVIGKTGIFDWLGDAVLRATGGSGKRLLLLIVWLVAPVCAVLPNATAVILVAPIIIGVCKALKIDFVGPMIITAIVSNAAGMLTLVGDPATFLVGSAIGLSFVDYLRMVSLGGVLAVLAVVPLLPKIWAARVDLPAARPRVAIERPGFLLLSLLVLVTMVALFLFGRRRHLCRQRQASDLHAVPAHWPADRGGAVVGRGPLCLGPALGAQLAPAD